MRFIICMLAFKFNPRKIDQVRCMCSDACLREYRKRKAGAMMIPAFAYRCIVSALGIVNLEYARIRTS